MEWQPIDSCPVGLPVLLYDKHDACKGRGCIVGMIDEKASWNKFVPCFPFDADHELLPSHWMPLPEPPKE